MLEMIGMPPTNSGVTYTLWPVNGTLNQMAFCLVRRKLLQICMATSNPGWAAWACRCLKHQAGERIRPTRLTTAPAGFSYRATRAKTLPLTGALFLWISSFKGTGIIVSCKPRGLVPSCAYISCTSCIFHLLRGVGSCLATRRNLCKLSSGISLLFPERTVASVSSLSDWRRMGCQCLPLSRIQLLGWEVAKNGPGYTFQACAFYWE